MAWKLPGVDIVVLKNWGQVYQFNTVFVSEVAIGE